MAWGSQPIATQIKPHLRDSGSDAVVDMEQQKHWRQPEQLEMDNPIITKHPVTPTCSSFDSLPVPPDGGYGWVICFAAFMCMIILDGMMFSFGVFFLDLLDSFGESKGKTSWVGSTLMGTHLIMGPLTAVLVNVYDCRRVAITGSIIATISFASSTFSPSLDILILLYGFLGGVGVSMIYIPAILTVGFYFEKKRAIANGIANSGSGFGTFIYAPLSRFLLDEYSWRGGLLILSGLVLNCAICASLFRPLEPLRGSTWKLPEPDFEKIKETQAAKAAKAAQADSQNHKLLCPVGANINITKSKSHGDIPSMTLSDAPLIRRHPKNSHVLFMSSVSLKTPDTVKKLLSLPKKKYYVSKEVLHRPMARKDAFYSGSLHRLELYQDPGVPFTLSMLRLPVPRGNDDDNMSETIEEQSVGELLHHMLGLGLLRSPMFLMCVFSGVLWTSHSSVLSCFPDYAVLSGIKRPQAALLVSIIGVSNIIGRLLAGFISDRPGVDPVWVNSVALLTGSSTTFAIPFTNNYIGLAMEAGIFGLCMGAWTSLRPIILVELLGLDRLTNAFGLMAMFQGIAFTVGSPIMGTLYDYTQSYMVPFMVAGSAFLISGICSLLMRPVSHFESRHRTDELDMEI